MSIRGCDSATPFKDIVAPCLERRIYYTDMTNGLLCKINFSFNVARQCSDEPVGCPVGGSRMRASALGGQESPCAVPGVSGARAPLPLFVLLSGGHARRGCSSFSGSPGDIGRYFFLSPNPTHSPAILYLPADTWVNRGHISGGRKCQSGEKFDRSQTRRRLIV